MVPKKKGWVEDFKDYRHNSLVGSLYKLIAKVHVDKLKKGDEWHDKYSSKWLRIREIDNECLVVGK